MFACIYLRDGSMVHFLGTDPDLHVHINGELLRQADGPMLKQGLEEMNVWRLELPKTWAKRPWREIPATWMDLFSHAR